MESVHTLFGFEGARDTRKTVWPVGQVVKTEASHAFNIGSNPVRVTTQKQAADRSIPNRWNEREEQTGNAPLAQLVEQLTLNQWVPGSSP